MRLGKAEKPYQELFCVTSVYTGELKIEDFEERKKSYGWPYNQSWVQCFWKCVLVVGEWITRMCKNLL